jgi:hypothetical protein
MEDEEEANHLGPWRERLYKYTPPMDVGGPPLYVMKYSDEIWLGFTKEPKRMGDVTGIYEEMISNGRAIKRRLKLGEWLDQQKSDPREMINKILFVESVDEVPYDEIFDDTEETPEGQAILEQVDMAIAVIDAGGGCTVCDAQPVIDPESSEKSVTHKMGCYLPGFSIWRMLHPEDVDRTPSLAMVIQAANEQIARMA